MKKFLLIGSLLAFTGGAFIGIGHAEEDPQITNLKVVRAGGDLDITWDNPDWSESGAEGVAVQWGSDSSKVGPEKSTKQRLKLDTESLTVRGNDFKESEYYFFMVSGYYRSGYKNRGTTLVYCSQMLRWLEKEDGTYENQLSDKSCGQPKGEEDENNDDSDTNEEVDSGLFGNFFTRAYETDIHLTWRPVTLNEDDFDGIRISVATDSSMDNVILDFNASRDARSARIKDLEPETKYYIQGEFYKNNSTFGEGAVEKVETRKEFTAHQRKTFETRVKNGWINLSADKIASVTDGSGTSFTSGEELETEDENEEEEDENEAYTPPTATQTTNTTTTTTSSSVTRTRAVVLKDIQDARTKLRALMKELRALDR